MAQGLWKNTDSFRWPWRRGPPLTIPNREVKPVCADGTATPSGRVGRRLFLKSLHLTMGGFFFALNPAWARLWRDQFPWPFVLHSVCTQGRSLDARLGRDWFQQPLLLRYACSIGLSLIGSRLFLESLHHWMREIIWLKPVLGTPLQGKRAQSRETLRSSVQDRESLCSRPFATGQLLYWYIEQLLHFRINGISTSSNQSIVKFPN